MDPMLFTTTSCTPHLYHPQQEENGAKITSVVLGVDSELSLGLPGQQLRFYLGYRNQDTVDRGGLSHGWTRSHKEMVSHDSKGGPGHTEGVNGEKDPVQESEDEQPEKGEGGFEGREGERPYIFLGESWFVTVSLA